jgi:hypothetical protein
MGQSCISSTGSSRSDKEKVRSTKSGVRKPWISYVGLQTSYVRGRLTASRSDPPSAIAGSLVRLRFACREIGLRSNSAAPASRSPYSQRPTYTRIHRHGLFARHGSRGPNATRHLAPPNFRLRSTRHAQKSAPERGRDRLSLTPCCNYRPRRASGTLEPFQILLEGWNEAFRGWNKNCPNERHQPRMLIHEGY